MIERLLIRWRARRVTSEAELVRALREGVVFWW